MAVGTEFASAEVWKPKTANRNPQAQTIDHLANERTFLAWVRTAVALMGFGFVIVKFALFLRQFSSVLDVKVATASRGYSVALGIVMVGLGAVMVMLAYFRYLSIDRHLRGGTYFPSKGLATLTAFCLLILSVLLLFYLTSGLK